MNELKREKEELMRQVGIEEENITNNLLKRLDSVWLSVKSWCIVTKGEGRARAKAGVWAGVYGEPSAETDPVHSQRKAVGWLNTQVIAS